MIHVLAPVPAVHLPEAIGTARQHGSVLLGSNQFELLESLRGAVATVWLVASTGFIAPGALPPVAVGKVLWKGRLAGVETADRRGRPTRPHLRPTSTASDTEWHMFYEVLDLAPVDPPIASANLRRIGGGRIEVAPHMLVMIESPQEKRP